ncbi:MAG: hypothetical protein HFJ34_06885 [Clostridia bacterium]|nr:hypothetical protein [Clostridia bacterium]
MENSANITQIIIDTINTIFETLFSSIDNNLYSVLDDITFINSDILQDKNFESLFGTSTSNGILLIANSFLLAFILYYAFRYLIAHFTYTQTQTPSSFIFKLILYGIAMNFSFFLLELVLDINSNVSLAIRNLGESLFHKNICFSELITTINTNIAIDTNSLNIFSLDGLIKGTLSISLLDLVFSYSLRYIFIKVFILLSPFAFLSLTLEQTNWFFKTWFRNLFSLLFIQIIVSIVLLILFSMDYSSSNLFTKFIYVGGMYALIKTNSLVRDFIGGVSTEVSQSVKNFIGLQS